MTGTHQQLVGFIWSVADLLRGDYKQSEYGKVILPLTVLRRLDAVLAPTKASVLATKAANEGRYAQISRLADAGLLYQVLPRFADLLRQGLGAGQQTLITAAVMGAIDVTTARGVA